MNKYLVSMDVHVHLLDNYPVILYITFTIYLKKKNNNKKTNNKNKNDLCRAQPLLAKRQG